MLITDGNAEEVERENSQWADLPRKIKRIAEGESSSCNGIKSLLEKQNAELSAFDNELGE